MLPRRLRVLAHHLATAPEAYLAAGSTATFIIWTWLTLTGRLSHLDLHLPHQPMSARSVPGQISETVSLLTHPIFALLLIAGLAAFSFHARMRRLALAFTVSAIGVAGVTCASLAVGRPRPSSAFADSISAFGGAYPATHVAAMTILAWVLVTLTRAHRRRTSLVARWALVGLLTVVMTALAQWRMGLLRPSDIIGGALLGLAVANLSLAVGGITPILTGWAHLGLPEVRSEARAAVVLNPTKFEDLSLLRRRVEAEVLACGWQPTLWLETTPDDPGYQAARRALAEAVDLILVAGGDGTVRAVASTLAGSGIPMALLPSGTGNLLARNLRIPLDTDAALRLALQGRAQAIDVVRVRASGPDGPVPAGPTQPEASGSLPPGQGEVSDSQPRVRTAEAGQLGAGEQRFVVMAGIGLDARIMADASAELKKVIRSGAYAVAAVQHAVPEPFTLTVTVDDAAAVTHQAVMALLGNVGTITGGMTLFRHATPTDGEVDLMVASPDRIYDWARLGAQILTGREQSGFTTSHGRRIVLETASPVPFEIDGDTQGMVTRLEATVEPGALRVIVPHRR